MDKIPEDVMQAAKGVWHRASGELINGMRGEIVVARAILAERKRCAEAVHRAAKDFYGNPDQMYAAARIATSIEAGA